MKERLLAIWEKFNRRFLIAQEQAHDTSGGFGALSKALRMLLQSAVLAVGAYLVIHGQATAGIIIAGSILSARALAPVELAIAHWRGFQAARQGAKRLRRGARGDADAISATFPAQAVRRTCRSKTPASRRRTRPPASYPMQASASRRVRRWASSGPVLQASRRWRGRWWAFGPWPRGKICLDGAALKLWPPTDSRQQHWLPAPGSPALRRHHRGEYLPLRVRMHPPRTLLLRQKQPACMR